MLRFVLFLVNIGLALGCQPGYYSSTGSAPCVTCAVGTYQPSSGAVTCVPCPKHTYASTPGASACLRCSAGMFTEISGQGRCVATFAPSYAISPMPTLRATISFEASLVTASAYFAATTLSQVVFYLSSGAKCGTGHSDEQILYAILYQVSTK